MTQPQSLANTNLCTACDAVFSWCGHAPVQQTHTKLNMLTPIPRPCTWHCRHTRSGTLIVTPGYCHTGSPAESTGTSLVDSNTRGRYHVTGSQHQTHRNTHIFTEAKAHAIDAVPQGAKRLRLCACHGHRHPSHWCRITAISKGTRALQNHPLVSVLPCHIILTNCSALHVL